MNSCYIHRLSDDILCAIFQVVSEEDQVTYHEYFHQTLNEMHWDDWGDDEDYYDTHSYFECPQAFPPSTLISAEGVCQRWKCLLSQMPSIWTVLQISFHEGAASLERARTFLRRSGTHPLNITLLWDNLDWVDPPELKDSHRMAGEPPGPSFDSIMAGIDLVLLLQELYAHVHRWREFTLRVTSVTHMYQALALMSRPSSLPVHMLEKLHLQLVHNTHAAHYIHESVLFPGSAPPIRDLLLFGIHSAWLSSSIPPSHLVNLRVYYYDAMNDDDPGLIVFSQLEDGFPNLQSLSLELDIIPVYHVEPMCPISLPQLRSLAIKSRGMEQWVVDFLCNASMPNLRILTLDGVGSKHTDLTDIIRELVRLTDPDTRRNPSIHPLKLHELHLLNSTYDANVKLVRRLYRQLAAVKVLTLGPGAGDKNTALAKGLLPAPDGLGDFPLPGLRALIIFDAPERLVRRVIQKRALVAGPLEELYYYTEDEVESDDWQHQVEKYHLVDDVKSFRHSDIVGRQWGKLDSASLP
ncbi:hypothetical protein M405DRAFT_819506 [Rhizopogon salebrosus TDB-379]|nr:hypothetical protein M405DRAFT_819506 [Rhizopogon salebrosus TDB-379]